MVRIDETWVGEVHTAAEPAAPLGGASRVIPRENTGASVGAEEIVTVGIPPSTAAMLLRGCAVLLPEAAATTIAVTKETASPGSPPPPAAAAAPSFALAGDMLRLINTERGENVVGGGVAKRRLRRP